MWTLGFLHKYYAIVEMAFFSSHGMDALGAHGLLSPPVRCLVIAKGEVGIILFVVCHCCILKVQNMDAVKEF
jgi:hypothetical protein